MTDCLCEADSNLGRIAIKLFSVTCARRRLIVYVDVAQPSIVYFVEVLNGGLDSSVTADGKTCNIGTPGSVVRLRPNTRHRQRDMRCSVKLIRLAGPMSCDVMRHR